MSVEEGEEDLLHALLDEDDSDNEADNNVLDESEVPGSIKSALSVFNSYARKCSGNQTQLLLRELNATYKMILKRLKSEEQQQLEVANGSKWSKILEKNYELVKERQSLQPSFEKVETSAVSSGEVDPTSGISICDRVLSADSVQNLVKDSKVVKLSNIVAGSAAVAELSQYNWVTFGIITEKAVMHNKGKGPYVVLKISQMNELDCPIFSLFLNDDAYEQHWKSLSVSAQSSVILIANPNVIPPTDKVNTNVAFAVSKANQFFQVGKFTHFGLCRGVAFKSQSACTMPVNQKIGDYCRHHISQMRKRQLQNRPHMASTVQLDKSNKSSDGVYFVNGSLTSTTALSTKQLQHQVANAPTTLVNQTGKASSSLNRTQQPMSKDQEKLVKKMLKQKSLGGRYVQMLRTGQDMFESHKESTNLSPQKCADSKPLTDLRSLFQSSSGTTSDNDSSTADQSGSDKIDTVELQIEQDEALSGDASARSSAMKRIIEQAQRKSKKAKVIVSSQQPACEQSSNQSLKNVLKVNAGSGVHSMQTRQFYCLQCSKLSSFQNEMCAQQKHSVEVKTVSKTFWKCLRCDALPVEVVNSENPPTFCCKGCNASDWIEGYRPQGNTLKNC
ncbi:hypothetical protein MIR68_004600 [Amoeboaphelidium protococcarum]|nr:hypothetical protein MIR68_004600 [Amoeboaphelidium protococcarum]